ncbi:hypothetical protein F5887DRAFT_967296 [Amanita rubescens]|nr:hypothetical protein F5887DRAFT_967296 [Amanita rubescens]
MSKVPFGSPAHTNGGLNEVEWRSHLQVTGDGDLGAVVRISLIFCCTIGGLCINIRHLPSFSPNVLVTREYPHLPPSLLSYSLIQTFPSIKSWSNLSWHFHAAFVQLALLARVSTGCLADMPSESQVLSKRKEQIYKRTPIDQDSAALMKLAGGAAGGVVVTGLGIAAATRWANRRKKSSAAGTVEPQGTGQGPTTPSGLEAGHGPSQPESHELQPGPAQHGKRYFSEFYITYTE